MIVDPDRFESRSLLHRVGLYLWLFVAIGVGGSILIYISVMQMSGWSLGGLTGGAAGGGASEVRVLLYKSPSTERFLASVGGRYEVLLQPWRAYAKANRVELSELPSLADLRPRPGDVLVLPSAVALDSAERLAVIQYQEAGGSLLLTWAAGSRNGNGDWAGWDFLHKTAGITAQHDLPADGSLSHLVSFGQGPLTHTLAAGTGIWLGKAAERPLVFEGAQIAAHSWNEARHIPSADIGKGILVFNEMSRSGASSRVAAFGAAETSWEYQPDDMHALMDGILAWLARRPTVVQSDWPNGLPAAYMVAVDAAGSADNLTRLADVFKSNQQTGSFYAVATDADAAALTMQRLAAEFDLGYQGDVDEGFKGQSVNLQRKRIQTMIAGVRSATRMPAVLPGFKAHAELYDDQTNQILYESGIQYHVTGAEGTRSRQPTFATIQNEQPGQRMVMLPRTVRDDLNLFSDTQGDVIAMEQAWLDDFYALKLHGGVGVLGLHADAFKPGSPLEQTLPKLLTHMRNHANTLWMANGRDIARWWNDRERFRFNARPVGARVEVDITVLGNEPFERAALVVILPNAEKLPNIRGLKSGMPDGIVTRLDKYRALIRFERIDVGNYTYQITF